MYLEAVAESPRMSTRGHSTLQTLIGRAGTREEVARAVVPLAENDLITGLVRQCDGALRVPRST